MNSEESNVIELETSTPEEHPGSTPADSAQAATEDAGASQGDPAQDGGSRGQSESGGEGEARWEEPARPRQPTYVETLERRLQEAQDQLREYIQAYKQVKEEQDGLKKRLEREAAREQDVMRGRLLGDLAGVLDNLDRSIQGADAGGSLADLLMGIKMVRAGFLERLQALGLEVIDPLGRPFDPNEAEALGLSMTGDPELDNTVALVFAKGYRLKDRVIRPAMVQVARYQDGHA